MWAKAFAAAWSKVVDGTTGEVIEPAPQLPCLWHLGGVIQSWVRASSISPARNDTTQVPAPRRRQTGLRRPGVKSRAGRPRIEAHPPDAGYWNDQVKPEPTHPLVTAGARALNSVEDCDAFVELA